MKSPLRCLLRSGRAEVGASSSIRPGRIACLCCALLAIILACSVSMCFPRGTLHAAENPNRGELRLLFAGDILLSRNVEHQLSRKPQAFVHALRPTFSSADLVVGNLEGAVGSPDDCHSSGPQPCFPIRDEFIPLLRQSGFGAIGLANNHSRDLGGPARETTRRMLVANGVLPLTYEDSPQFIKFGDQTIALISLSLVPGRDDSPVDIPDTVLRQKLRMAKHLANMVVVYIHWGSEFLDWPDKKQRQAAQWLIHNGTDLIIGHHPHMIQKPEVIDGKAVFFSLGNLVFDQKYPSTREGLLADCRIRKGIATCSAVSTRTPAGSTLPVIDAVDAVSGKALSEYALKLPPSLEINGIIIRPDSSGPAENTAGFLLEGSRAGSVLWKTRHARIVSMERMWKPNGRPPDASDQPGSGAGHSPYESTLQAKDRNSEVSHLLHWQKRQRLKAEEPHFQASDGEYLFTLERHFSPLDSEHGLRPCVYEARPDGLAPIWRGSALAWPLIDAAFLPGNKEVLCALHRRDSFLVPQPQSNKTRVAAYRWKGFGFSGIHDQQVIESCREFIQ